MTARLVDSFLEDFFPYLLTPALSIVMALLLFGVFIVWLIAVMKSKRLGRLWGCVYPMLSARISLSLGSEATSALLDIFGWFGGFAQIPPQYQGLSSTNDQHIDLILRAKKTLSRLLNRLTTEEARALTENNRQVLLRLAQNAEMEVDLGIGALLTLGVMQEARARPVAQKLIKSFLPRVREAARECFKSL
ncbi:hypothetical protein [Armatimonas sp.]|uniref:hypothetical protein n=1 Tax=Armatimonas sp. TaxID=1872638 RepID=UPI00286B52EB|nr:hypothetical protein [Armatimonas sp.]